MNIKPNQFFDPKQCPYEAQGFYEEYIELPVYNVLGWEVLAVNEAPRALGSDGRLEFELTHNLTLTKGMKQVVVKASPQRPRKVVTMVQVICGKTKNA